MEPFHDAGSKVAPFLTIPAWSAESPKLRVGMSARDHYSLHRKQDEPNVVVANRQQLVHALGFTLDAWTSGVQVHGTNIARVTRAERGAGNRMHETAIQATDGLITDEEDVLLTAFYADCVPLLFWDPDHEAVGVAHAGWRGTALGIARNMVEQMKQEFSTKPGRLRVAIGPAIGACCYEVDDRVIEAMKKQLPSLSEEVVQAKANGRYMLDLKQANADIIKDTGIQDQHVLVTHYCTCCEERLFFSHRRDPLKAGRMVAYIGKRKDET